MTQNREEGFDEAHEDETDEIIHAIRRIMKAEKALSDDTDVVAETTEAVEERVLAALKRLAGGRDTPPTVLEALILERLDPLLDDWISRHLPALAERLVREEIRRLMDKAGDT